MNNKKYKLGMTGCYICDHPFSHVTDIPVEAAVEWVKNVAPEITLGSHVKTKDITTDGNRKTDAIQNGWLNKLFVIVAHEPGKFIALYNHDGVFSVRIEQLS